MISIDIILEMKTKKVQTYSLFYVEIAVINITLTFYENNFIFSKAKTISKTSNIVLHF